MKGCRPCLKAKHPTLIAIYTHVPTTLVIFHVGYNKVFTKSYTKSSSTPFLEFCLFFFTCLTICSLNLPIQETLLIWPPFFDRQRSVWMEPVGAGLGDGTASSHRPLLLLTLLGMTGNCLLLLLTLLGITGNCLLLLLTLLGMTGNCLLLLLKLLGMTGNCLLLLLTLLGMTGNCLLLLLTLLGMTGNCLTASFYC